VTAGQVYRNAGSLRRRVTVATVAVSVVVLLAVIVIVNVALSVIVNRSMAALLTEQVQVARELTSHGTPPAEMVAQLQSRTVHVRLVLTDGRVFGTLDGRIPRDSTSRTRTIRLTAPEQPLNDANLTLRVDVPLIGGVQHQVIRVLLLVAAAAVVAVAVIVPFTARVALAPLDRMTRVARGIAGGRRGDRLDPEDTTTELGRTALAFDEMLDALEGAERRALVSEQGMRRFVADAAHELRTPIAGITAAAEAVLQQPLDAEADQRQRLLLALGREARQAGRLIEELLDVARIDSGLALHLEVTDLRQICLEQAERVTLVNPGSWVDVQGPAPTVLADPIRISQAVGNLVNNACAVSPTGGRVVVALSRTKGGVSVFVLDNGPGVPPDDRERIFERLVRLDVSRSRGHDGAGLGLTIARGIARAHGGEVRCCAPEPGSTGAVFELWLPDHR
jgi:two-component system, OmpR family, sensor kinase